MQATISDAGTLRKQLTVTYTPAEVAARREQVLKQYAGQVKLDGFRPGKSSKMLVEKRFGQAAEQKAQEELADEGFNQGVKQHQVKPIGPISNDKVSREQGLTIVCSFEIRPAITLPEPASLGVAKAEAAVSDQEAADALANLCKRAGTMAELAAGTAIAADDSVTLTGTVNVAGKEVRKLHDFHHLVGGYALLGKPPAEVVALFKAQTVGGELRFTTNLPTSFTPADAAGKEAEVAVTIQSAQRQTPAPADDALATRLGVENLETLKTRLREQLVQQKEQELHQKQITDLTEALLAKTTVEIPPKLLEGVLRDNVDTKVAQAEKDGKPADEITKLREQGKADAERSLKRYLVLDTAAEVHQVQVSREDLEGQIQMAAARSGRKPQEIADQLLKSGQLNQVVQEIREAKTLEVMLDKALGRESAANPAHGLPGHQHGPECQHGHAHG
jgi:trigger factor